MPEPGVGNAPDGPGLGYGGGSRGAAAADRGGAAIDGAGGRSGSNAGGGNDRGSDRGGGGISGGAANSGSLGGRGNAANGGFGGGNDRGGGGISGGAANAGALGGRGNAANAANGGFGGGGYGGGVGPGRGDPTGGFGPGGAGGNVAGQTAAASGQSVSGAAIDGVNAALGSEATDSTAPGATSLADVFGGVNAVPGLPGVSATPGITVSDALTPSTQTVASTYGTQIAQNLAQAQNALTSPTSVTSALASRTSTPMGLTAISGFNTTPASNLLGGLAMAGTPMDAISAAAAQAMTGTSLGVNSLSTGMMSDMATMSAKDVNSALGMDGTLADSSSTGVDFGDIAGMGVAQAALGAVNAPARATTAEDALNNDIIGAMNSVPSTAAQQAAQEAALAQAMNSYDARLAARGFQAIDPSTTDANALAIGLGPINDPATFSATPAQTAASMAMVDDPSLAPSAVAQAQARAAERAALLDRTFSATPSRVEALSANRQQVSTATPNNDLLSRAFAATPSRMAALNPATASPAIGPAPDTNLSGVPGAFSNANDLSGYMDVTNAVNSYNQGKYGQAVSDLIDSVGLSNAIQMGGLLFGGSGSGLGPREPGGGDGGLLADSGRGGSGGSGGGDGNNPTPPSGYMPDWWMDWRNSYGQYGLLGPIPVRNAQEPGGYVYA